MPELISDYCARRRPLCCLVELKVSGRAHLPATSLELIRKRGKKSSLLTTMNHRRKK
jgi:hypothetical protein